MKNFNNKSPTGDSLINTDRFAPGSDSGMKRTVEAGGDGKDY